ncbi:MAG: hypothetical protein ACM31O_01645 [Bacteroidota bacterium]
MATMSPELLAAITASLAEPANQWVMTAAQTEEFWSVAPGAEDISVVTATHTTYQLESAPLGLMLIFFHETDTPDAGLALYHSGFVYRTSDAGLLATLTGMVAAAEAAKAASLIASLAGE